MNVPVHIESLPGIPWAKDNQLDPPLDPYSPATRGV